MGGGGRGRSGEKSPVAPSVPSALTQTRPIKRISMKAMPAQCPVEEDAEINKQTQTHHPPKQSKKKDVDESGKQMILFPSNLITAAWVRVGVGCVCVSLF